MRDELRRQVLEQYVTGPENGPLTPDRAEKKDAAPGSADNYIAEQQTWQKKQYTPWEYGGVPAPGAFHGDNTRNAILWFVAGAIGFVFAGCVLFGQGYLDTDLWGVALVLCLMGLLYCWIGLRYIWKARKKKHPPRKKKRCPLGRAQARPAFCRLVQTLAHLCLYCLYKF